jgi:hypothetical protein
MLIVLIFLAFLVVVYPLCFYGGYRIAIRSRTNYKQRWLEAVKLIEAQQEVANLIDSGEAQAIVTKVKELRQLEANLPNRDAWALDIVYRDADRNSLNKVEVTFYAVRDGQRVRLGTAYDPSDWPATFNAETKKAQNALDLMNQAIGA